MAASSTARAGLRTNPRDKTGRQHANQNIKVKQLTKSCYTKAAGLSTQSGITRDLRALAGLETQSAAALDRCAQLQVERLLIWQASLSSGSRSSAPPRQLTGAEWLDQTEENVAPDRLRPQTGEQWLNQPEEHVWEDPLRLRSGWEYLDFADDYTPLPPPLNSLDGLRCGDMAFGQKCWFRHYRGELPKKERQRPDRHPCNQQ